VKPELRTYRFVFHAVFASLLLFFLFRAAVGQQTSLPAPAAPSPAAPSASAHTSPPAPDPLVPTPVAVTPEKWTRLELDPANFALLEPANGGEDGNDKFYRELVQLQWRVGDPVEVYVVRPKGIARPPVVLYQYGYNENLDRFKNDRYCERLTAGGYAAVGFEPALGVDRFRSGRPMKEWFVSELQESLGSSVHDVQLVLNYLESRKDLDLDHAGIFGQGSGGAIAILAAATDSRLKAVDTLNPWGDWNDWLAKSSAIPEVERPAYLKPEFLDMVKPLEPVRWLPKVKAPALRLQFVTANPSVPEAAMEQMESAAGHDTASTHYTVTRYRDTQDLIRQTDGGRLFDWVKARLATGAEDGQAKAAERQAAKPAAAAPASGKADAAR
jgi:hypothetical protein